jgi:tetratricopeptide (TPR) repeat protein
VREILFFAAFRGGKSRRIAELLGEDADLGKRAAKTLLEDPEGSRPYLIAALNVPRSEAERVRITKLLSSLEMNASLVRETIHGAEEIPAMDGVPFGIWAAGIRKKASRVVLASRPTGLRAAEIHFDEERSLRALEILAKRARAHPGELDAILESMNLQSSRIGTKAKSLVGEICGLARKHTARLDLEGRARMAYLLASHHDKGWRAGHLEVAMNFPGTEWGRMSEFVGIRRGRGDVKERVEKMAVFAAKHRGTRAETEALGNISFQLSCGNMSKRGEDPIWRLERLADAVRCINEGPFSGTAGSKAEEYLEQFFVYKPKYSEGSPERIMKAYRIFFAYRFLVDEFHPRMKECGFTFRNRFSNLHAELGAKPEELTGKLLEELDTIEARSPWADHVRYFRALFLLGEKRTQEGVAVLTDLAKGDNHWGRKASAAAATVAYARGKWEDAKARYGNYLESHPRTPYGWIAALRRGHCDVQSGNLDRAVDGYRSARAAFSDHPLLVVLAHGTIGRVMEIQENYEMAAFEYGKALDAWDGDFGGICNTQLEGMERVRGAHFDPDAGFSREWLRARVAALNRVGRDHRSERLLEEANALIKRGKRAEALTILEALASRVKDQALGERIRRTVADLHLESALLSADRAEGTPDPERIDARLKAAVEWGEASHAFAASFCRSLLTLREEGGEEKAKRLLGEALKARAESQTPEKPGTGLEADVAAIRAAAFQPYSSDYRTRMWSPPGPYPYLVVQSEIKVVFSDGSSRQVDIRPEMKLPSKVLYFTSAELLWISKIIDRCGGSKRTRPKSVMGVEKPAGDAEAIRALVSGYFPLFAGHWGGWHVRSYPSFSSLSFSDAKRTSATVKFRVGYRGGDTAVKKVSGTWALKGVQFRWIE